MSKNWSNYQNNIFSEVKFGSKHIIIEARAGAAKTTSLVESLKHIPTNQNWLVVAFNKKIADELKLRTPEGGSVFTLHALGLKCISSTYEKVTVNNDKIFSITEKIIGKDDSLWDIRNAASKTIAFAKATLSSKTNEIDDLIDQFDIEIFDYDRNKFIAQTIACLDLCKSQTHVIDFNDMCWFPNVLKLNIPTYDNIFIDEAQDLNLSQIKFALKLVKPSGRILSFLDQFQNIYGFRAANGETVINTLQDLEPKSLPLSICYRCPSSVVKEAQKYVKDIEVAPNAKEGEVKRISTSEMYKLAKPGCFIISRTNAPMIGICLKFLKEGIPANIQGRDVGANLLALVKKSKAKTIAKLHSYIDSWELKETARLMKKKKDISSVKDKAECIRALAEPCSTVAQVKESIKNLFADDDSKKKVLLISVHRAKGDERDQVFLLWSTFFGDDQEANNLRYVAITRSKDKLYYVQSGKKE